MVIGWKTGIIRLQICDRIKFTIRNERRKSNCNKMQNDETKNEKKSEWAEREMRVAKGREEKKGIERQGLIQGKMPYRLFARR